MLNHSYTISSSTKQDLVDLARYLFKDNASNCELELRVNSCAKIRISMDFTIIIDKEDLKK